MEPLLGIISLILIIFIAYMIDKRNKVKKTINDKKHEKGASLFIKLPILQGLPVSEKTLCDILSCPTYYEFNVNNTTFKLDKEKIQDISIKTDTEIQKYYTSSIGGAIGGAVLFGPIGAMIGGRTKKKTNSTAKNYLIFTYLKDDNIQYISFDATNSLSAMKFVNEFKKSNPNRNTTIEL